MGVNLPAIPRLPIHQSLRVMSGKPPKPHKGRGKHHGNHTTSDKHDKQSEFSAIPAAVAVDDVDKPE